MRRLWLFALTAVSMLIGASFWSAAPAVGVSTTLVINEIDYDQDGTDATEFVEIKNVSAGAIDLDAYTLQLINGASGSAVSYDTIDLPAVSLASGDYYVVCANATTVVNCDLDDSPDTNFIQNGAPDAVALLMGVTVVDTVSYEGDTTGGFTEGTGTTATDVDDPVTVGISRCADGVDTDNNNNDFVLVDSTPGTANDCPAGDSAPSVASTTPSDGAGAVAEDANIELTFSEDVDLASGAITVTCTVSGVHSGVTSGGPLTFTFNPDVDFTAGETCTANVMATAITDEDSDDPPDNMAADHDFSFTVFAITLIHAVQGSVAGTTPGTDDVSPLSGQTVSVEGVVTGSYQTQGSGQLRGFFVQEQDADVDADPATSEGIFIFCSSCPTTVGEGDVVQVTGAVSEFFGMTQISATTADSVLVLDSGDNLGLVTPTAVDLPIAGDVNAFYERLEGMLLAYADTLTVSEYFELFRYGQVVLYQGGRPFQFTETSTPDAAGYSAHRADLAARRVILDDENNRQNWPLDAANGEQFIFHPQANGGFGTGTQGADYFRGGDEVLDLVGILHWSFAGQSGTDAWRVRPTKANPVEFTAVNTRPSSAADAGGSVKVASFNVLNYFTTIDTTSSNSTGTCGPSGTLDCRGADSLAELDRQRERTAVAICGLDADVVGLMELENDTSATLTDLTAAVNAECGGSDPYAFVDTGGFLGDDAIKVGIIYRSSTVAPVGAALSDLDPVHDRPPLGQTFRVVDGGNASFDAVFSVVVNHFKSKGCTGAAGLDVDQGDGQGCYNARRTAQATRLTSWVNSTLIPAAGDPDVLLIGDFNSYALEDPIATLKGAGYTDIAAPGDYSYLFDGQLGRLDYVLASASIFPQVAGHSHWHINADEVPVFDYNDETKDTGEASFEEKPDGSSLGTPRTVFEPGTPFRASDHDPLIVGLDLFPGTPPNWYVIAKKSNGNTYQPGAPDYIPGTWSQQRVAVHLFCAPGSSPIDTLRRDQTVSFGDGVHLYSTRANDECVDETGVAAAPLAGYGPIMVDTKAPVCRVTPTNLSVARGSTASVAFTLNVSDATSGIASVVMSYQAVGGAVVNEVSGTNDTTLNVTMPNATTGRVSVTWTVTDVAGNVATCRGQIRAK